MVLPTWFTRLLQGGVAPHHFLPYPMGSPIANLHRYCQFAPERHFLLSSCERYGNSTPHHDPFAMFRNVIFQKSTLLLWPKHFQPASCPHNGQTPQQDRLG